MMSSPEVTARGNEMAPDTPAASAVPVVNLTAMDDPSTRTAATDLDSSRVRQNSTTLSELPFSGEDLVRVEAARLKTLNLCECELSHEFFSKTTLTELKTETVRWHQAGCQIEEDLRTLDILVEGLKGKSQREGAAEDATMVTEGPLQGRTLTQVLAVLYANRGRLQAISDGEAMYSYAYFCKYTSMDDASLPAFTANLQELQRDGVLEVILWAALKTAETQSTVTRLTDFMGEVQNHLKMPKEGNLELSQRLVELAGGVIGIQSATRVSIEDGKQHQRAVNRSLENLLWQVAGSGKAQNQSLKDVNISSARMLQGINDHMNKSNKVAEGMAETLENVEGHLATLNEHMKKLNELQQKSLTEGGKTTNVPGQQRVDPGVASTAAAKAATAAQLGTTGRAAKAMPVQPEVVSSAANPLPMPPVPPPQLGQNLVAGGMPPRPPTQIDPNLAGMAMPS